jgi:tetratricopeptide (TPR) repeat protein
MKVLNSNSTEGRHAKRQLDTMWVLIALMAVAICMSGDVVISRARAAGSHLSSKPTGYAGSMSCRQCHERFYQLWSKSWHGLAMQPYTQAFARKELTPQKNVIKIGGASYRTDISGSIGFLLESEAGGERKYRIEHVMGGKNVYYFLTMLEKGRLQTLPLAYDVRNKNWFDTAASGVRHFPGGRASGQLHWKSAAYTFNTSCYSCHVSQLSTNYDLAADTYGTKWAEPGINCETCHGPSSEHNRVFRESAKGAKPQDMKIISWKSFTPEQKTDACSTCHARRSPITPTFLPGDRYFDHFDLVTLEDPDFYPDGRDLGENYTYTSWRMSPCARSGKLHCVTCHTSSGRYRFKAEEKANQACMPCHESHVKNAPAHTRHQALSPGNRCISCHMPMTTFARMNRTDHSMLPPTPGTTITYKSPNACNLCHTDKDAAWADRLVRKWRKRDYQARVLKRASLIDAGRKQDWGKLPEMLEYIQSKDRDEVFATSLLRLIPASGDPRIVPVLLRSIKDSSPLVRSAAATALQDVPTKEPLKALMEATKDEYRLVRVRAAASLAAQENFSLDQAGMTSVAAANQEYLASILSRPDQWDAHYNMGNYRMSRGDPKEAIASFDTALRLDPRAVPALVNQSIAYARLGETQKAVEALHKALGIAPDNAAAHFNMGLLRAELNDMKEAESQLREALKTDPRMGEAAYNLCVILAKDRPDEALRFCRQAVDVRPQDPRYAYTLAFYQQQRGSLAEAVKVLDELIVRHPAYADAYLLLGGIQERQGNRRGAVEIYKRGVAEEGIAESRKLFMKARMEALTPDKTGSGEK